jgi:hypothetical protein
MSSKIKLLTQPGAMTVKKYQSVLWSQYFDLEEYNPEKTYPAGTLFKVDFYESLSEYLDQGFKVFVDHVWDSAVYQRSTLDPVMTLRAEDWIWIHEYLLCSYHGYNVPRPADNPTKFFLMPMNLRRYNRDDLLAKMQPFLDHSIWSYVNQGRILPGEIFVPHPVSTGILADRNYDPAWYADTCFSMVSETAVDTARMGFGLPSGELFISEKIFKPLSYQHPFVVYGTHNTLQYLHSRGFATFGDIVDESYDTVQDPGQRLEKITQVVTDLYSEFCSRGSVFQTPQAQGITEHNYNHFWNYNNVRALFEKQIVEPILEFAGK